MLVNDGKRYLVGEEDAVFLLLPAFVFHGNIVATLGSKAYHWGTFITEAKIKAIIKSLLH